MYSINLTLGHNSAAALFKDGECLCAYEEERLSKVKSDGSFPKLAIEECLRATSVNPLNVKGIKISHWFNGKAEESKYYAPKYLAKRFPNAEVVEDMNHHLNHAHSVWNFSGTDEGLTVIIDGFGNNEECVSVYIDGTSVYTLKGVDNSLGLMYQYATSAAGLKELEDEYKLLGYEIHSKIKPYIIPMPVCPIEVNEDEFIDLRRLNYVKAYWHSKFSGMSREDIARLVQFNLEHRVLSIIGQFMLPNELVQLGGGVFYNVKLNNAIVRRCAGTNKVCVNPLCGDQGNVFGYPNMPIEKLDLGIRDVIPRLNEAKPGITESFFGNMEFGPRALGNTSTLALPTLHNVHTINKYNNRDTMMPMAPIITREFFEENFKNTTDVLRSEKYMVISFDFKVMKDEWRGAAHYDPDRDVYTGRVQVLDEGDCLYDYVKNLGGILINTSLNFHGTPILFNDLDYENYQNLKIISH